MSYQDLTHNKAKFMDTRLEKRNNMFFKGTILLINRIVGNNETMLQTCCFTHPLITHDINAPSQGLYMNFGFRLLPQVLDSRNKDIKPCNATFSNMLLLCNNTPSSLWTYCQGSNLQNFVCSLQLFTFHMNHKGIQGTFRDVYMHLRQHSKVP